MFTHVPIHSSPKPSFYLVWAINLTSTLTCMFTNESRLCPRFRNYRIPTVAFPKLPAKTVLINIYDPSKCIFITKLLNPSISCFCFHFSHPFPFYLVPGLKSLHLSALLLFIMYKTPKRPRHLQHQDGKYHDKAHMKIRN